jgi:MscS family membrane protein
LLVALLAFSAARVQAQRDSTRSDSSRVAASAQVSPVSPRKAVEQFLVLARAGEWEQASSYLDLPESEPADGKVARQLKAVLDEHLWINLDDVSKNAAGDTLDGLAAGVDQIGAVRGPNGALVPIQLARNTDGAEAPWRFVRATVQQVPALYQVLRNRWAIDHLPEVLLRPGYFELLLWQWAVLPFLIVVATLLGIAASRALRAGARRIVGRTRSGWADAILSRIGSPLSAALTLAAVAALLPLLSLYRPAAETSYDLVKGVLFLIFFWSLWRIVDVILLVLSSSRWARASASSRALLPLAGRVSKIIILAFASVAALQLAGYPVASLIAGLGLGGLALALAAQKTVENLFGAFSLGVDQPIREGDLVRVEDFEGTVERIGLRSTRFRTLDRTIITIPNGRLADMRLESLTARDRMRLAAVIGLHYRTTAEQLREVLSGFEHVLREHPSVWRDVVSVRFIAFGASSLNIEVMAWFRTAEPNEFQQFRQDVLLQFMDVVEQAGTSFAFPTQTLQIESLPVAPAES